MGVRVFSSSVVGMLVFLDPMGGFGCGRTCFLLHAAPFGALPGLGSKELLQLNARIKHVQCLGGTRRSHFYTGIVDMSVVVYAAKRAEVMLMANWKCSGERGHGEERKG